MAIIANRLNSLLLVLVLLALLAIIGMLASGARGGPLDPPGAPCSTDSVRLPGTPISSLPFTISQSGSYYLTRNLASSTDGIIVTADNVTIDLMGFTLSGPGGQEGVSDAAVARFNITVRNGTLRGWGTAVYLTASAGVDLEDLRIVENNRGIAVGTGGVLARLLVRNNSNTGIEVYQSPNQYGTELRDSNISNNGGSGIVNFANNVWIHGNIVDANGDRGILLINNASWNKVTDNRVSGNGFYGISIDKIVSGQPNVNMVARNQIVGNGFGAVYDSGVGNRIGTFVGGDASITATNPWSNVVY